MTKLTFQQCADILGLKIKRQLAPVKPDVNCFGRYNKRTHGITIHQTGNPAWGANAQMHANLQSRVYGASWHWTIDDEGAIQSFEDDTSLWHASDGAGNGNMNTIGFEGCINADGNYVESVKNMAKLAACYCYKYGWLVDRFVNQHYDYARDKKNCPAQIRSAKAGIGWGSFKQMVKDYVTRLNQSTAKRLKSEPIQGYSSPQLPFKALNIGTKVTLAKGAKWVDLNSKELLTPSVEVAGKTDTIKQVKELSGVSNSKRAYLMTGFNSWILEEYLEEPRADWIKVEDTDIKKEDRVNPVIDKKVDPKYYQVKEGQFYQDGILYEIKKA